MKVHQTFPKDWHGFCRSITSVILLICFVPSAIAATPTWKWSRRLGGSDGSDIGYGVAIGSNGNIIVAGQARGAIDINADGDKTDGSLETGTGYQYDDGILSVFNSTGGWLWGRRFGGTTSNDDIYSVATDSSGSIIVTGYVTGNADVNGDGDATDSGAEDATGFSNQDVLLSTFSSTGSWQWAKRLGGTGNDYGYGVTTNQNNTIFVTGTVSNTSDLNGDGDALDSGENAAEQNHYITAFSSTGSWQWLKRIGATEGSNVNGIVATKSGSVVIIGGAIGDADLNGDGDATDGGAESATGYAQNDIFVTVFNSTGSWLWAKRLGGAGATAFQPDIGYGAGYSSDRVVVTGYVYGDADVNGDADRTDGGAESGTGYGGTDLLISVFDASGTWQWAKRLGGSGTDFGKSVTYDSDGNIVVIGVIVGDADVNGDGDATDGEAESGTGYGDSDMMISVFSATGSWLWGKRFGGTDLDHMKFVAADDDGRIAATGLFTGDADVNGDGDATDGDAESSTGFGGQDLLVSVFLLDVEPPTSSAFSPAASTIINDTTPAITFSLNENGDCRASTDGDESYSNMSDDTDCTGDETQSMTCQMGDLGSDGNKTIYVACRDMLYNEDGSDTNEELAYTLDTVSPTVFTLSPTDNASGIAVTANLLITFNEPTGKTGRGYITIYKASDDSIVEQINTATGSVSGSGSTTITIDPTVTLSNATAYYVKIDTMGLPDAAGNFFVGITDSTTWNFTTVATTMATTEAPASTSQSGGGRGKDRKQPTITPKPLLVTSPPTPSAIAPPSLSSLLQFRICRRVAHRFSDPRIIERINRRLQKRYGWECHE